MCQQRQQNATPDLESRVDVIRAWKDESYRLSLNEEQRALVPANPAGAIELDDRDLDQAAGGLVGQCGCTGGCSHHCGVMIDPGTLVINPVVISPIVITPIGG